jgi:hypothetical protein
MYKLTLNVLDEDGAPIKDVLVNSSTTNDDGTVVFWGSGKTEISVKVPNGYYPKCVLNAGSFNWNQNQYGVIVDLTKDVSVDVIFSTEYEKPSLYSSSQEIISFYFLGKDYRLTIKAITPSETLNTMALHSLLQPERVLQNGFLIEKMADKESFQLNNNSCWFFEGEELKIKNKYSGSLTLDIDYTNSIYLPYAKILSPSLNSIVGGNVEVKVEVNSLNFDWAELRINDQTVQSWTLPFTNSETWIYNWNTEVYPDSNYILKLLSYDKAGSTKEDSITGTVDNTKPSVNIISPDDGNELRGEFANLEFTATDENLESLQLLIDEIGYDVTGRTNFMWNTTKVGDGNHLIKLVAFDKAGNQAETSVNVSTINAKLEIVRTRNIYIVIGIVIGLVLGVAAVYFAGYWPTREKGRRERANFKFSRVFCF